MLQSQKLKCLVLWRYLNSDPQNGKPERLNSGYALRGSWLLRLGFMADMVVCTFSKVIRLKLDACG